MITCPALKLVFVVCLVPIVLGAAIVIRSLLHWRTTE